ncbi:MAG: CdiA family toxin C-terminal domain-containing protein, partial [Candidatus Adiutrix sp.]
TNLASTAIGAAAGGTTGAVAASTMDRYNRQLHPIEIARIRELATKFAEEQGISEAEALTILAGQALRNVAGASVTFNEEANEFLLAHGGVFYENGKEYTFFTATQDEQLNFALFSQYIAENREFYDKLPLVATLYGSGRASEAAISMVEATFDMRNMLNEDPSTILEVYSGVISLLEYYENALGTGEISEDIYNANIRLLNSAQGHLVAVMYNKPELSSLVNMSDLMMATTNYLDDMQAAQWEGALAKLGDSDLTLALSVLAKLRSQKSLANFTQLTKNSGKFVLTPELEQHILYGSEGSSRRNGISGAHNQDAFFDAFNKANAEIVSIKPNPKLPGTTVVEYKIPALDPKTNQPTGGFINKTYTKTIYDPKKVSAQQFLNWGLEAANNSTVINYHKNTTLPNTWVGIDSNGAKWLGFFDKNGNITSYFPDHRK